MQMIRNRQKWDGYKNADERQYYEVDNPDEAKDPYRQLGDTVLVTPVSRVERMDLE